MSEDGQKLLHHRRTPHSDTASDLDVGFEHVPPPLLGSTSAVEIGDGDNSDAVIGDQFVANQSMDSLLDGDYDAVREENGSLSNLRLPLSTTFNPSGTNTLFTVFLIVNAALGAGLLNFPKAFDKAGGVGVGLAVQAVLLVFILVALVVLAYTADQNAAETIQEAMEAAGGKQLRRFTSACVIIYTFGTCITFLIIIGDQFDRLLASLYGHTFCHYWYMNRDFTMTVSCVLLILPLCYSKKIDFLRVPSAIGVVAIFYIIALIIYEKFYGGFTPGPIKTAPSAWTDVFLVVPDICFGYQCHVSVIPIYSCMRHRTVPKFTIASFTAVLVCALCYSGAAVLGYLTFGGFVREDVLMSYPGNRVEVQLAIGAMALKTYSTYPILLFCGREALRNLLQDCSGWDLAADPNAFRFTSIAVTVWFALSVICAALIPNIGVVIQMLGSLAAVFIFVLPGLGLLQYAIRADPSYFLWKTYGFVAVSMLFLFIGAFITGTVLTQSVMHIAAGGEHSDAPPPLCY